MGQNKELIEAKNLWKIYGKGEAKTVVLKGINLKIKEGEFVAIIGPSGYGKSTLLNILGLLDVPNKGMIYIKADLLPRLKSWGSFSRV